MCDIPMLCQRIARVAFDSDSDGILHWGVRPAKPSPLDRSSCRLLPARKPGDVRCEMPQGGVSRCFGRSPCGRRSVFCMGGQSYRVASTLAKTVHLFVTLVRPSAGLRFRPFFFTPFAWSRFRPRFSRGRPRSTGQRGERRPPVALAGGHYEPLPETHDLTRTFFPHSGMTLAPCHSLVGPID